MLGISRLSNWFSGLLFGYDLFVSYSRRDGSDYARALADELRKTGYKCFLDDREMPAGSVLDAAVQAALARSSALAIVVTNGALASQHVATEILNFEASKRHLVPIDIGRALESGDEHNRIVNVLKTRIWLSEPLDRLQAGPSPITLDRLISTFSAVRRSRIRTAVASFVIASLTVLLFFVSTLWRSTTLERDRADSGARDVKLDLSRTLLQSSNPADALRSIQSLAADKSLSQPQRNALRQLLLRTLYGSGNLQLLSIDTSYDQNRTLAVNSQKTAFKIQSGPSGYEWRDFKTGNVVDEDATYPQTINYLTGETISKNQTGTIVSTTAQSIHLEGDEGISSASFGSDEHEPLLAVLRADNHLMIYRNLQQINSGREPIVDVDGDILVADSSNVIWSTGQELVGYNFREDRQTVISSGAGRMLATDKSRKALLTTTNNGIRIINLKNNGTLDLVSGPRSWAANASLSRIVSGHCGRAVLVDTENKIILRSWPDYVQRLNVVHRIELAVDPSNPEPDLKHYRALEAAVVKATSPVRTNDEEQYSANCPSPPTQRNIALLPPGAIEQITKPVGQVNEALRRRANPNNRRESRQADASEPDVPIDQADLTQQEVGQVLEEIGTTDFRKTVLISPAPNGESFLVIDQITGTASIHSYGDGETISSINLFPSQEWSDDRPYIRSVEFCPDSSCYAVLDSTGRLEVRDTKSGTVLLRLQVPLLRRAEIAFSQDLSRLVVAGPTKLTNESNYGTAEAVLLRIALPRRVTFFPTGSSRVDRWCSAIAAGGDRVVLGSCIQSSPFLLLSGKGERLASLAHGEEGVVSISSDGKLIATAADQVRIWNARDGALVAHFDASYPAIDYANDGRYLIARPQQGNSNQTINIFDINKGVSLATDVTGNELARTPKSLDGSASFAVSLAASPSGPTNLDLAPPLAKVTLTRYAENTKKLCGESLGTFDVNNSICVRKGEVSVWPADGIERKLDTKDMGTDGVRPQASTKNFVALAASGESAKTWLFGLDSHSLIELKAFGPEDFDRSEVGMMFFSKSGVLVGAVYENGLIALWNTDDGQLAGKVKLAQLSFASGFFDKASETLLVVGPQEDSNSEVAFSLKLPEELTDLVQLATDAYAIRENSGSSH